MNDKLTAQVPKVEKFLEHFQDENYVPLLDGFSSSQACPNEDSLHVKWVEVDAGDHHPPPNPLP